MTSWRDSWRLSVGTFTAIGVTPPGEVTPAGLGRAVLLAPLAVTPLAAAAGLVLWGGRELDLAPLGVAAAVIAVLALGSRVFHLDGLADTADGLTASYDAERSLQIMKRGDTGPAGAVAIALVLAIQIGSVAALATHSRGPQLVALLVIASRGAAALGCVRGIAPARSTGLGSSVAGTVGPGTATLLWLGLTAMLAAGFHLADLPWWRGLVAAAAALTVVAWLLRRAVRRFGGIVGDVLGANVEIALAVLLLAST